ncbi:N-6 DNA methylase [Streptomyces klenkii]|uniref:N-6 DNA methylase n=1 Tax=Streptomyces klenkii TaxID=1420899 RepID=UPI0036E63C1F
MGLNERDPLITRTEIATQAGVARPTVTTWEKRHGDFPAPVRSGGAEYFHLSEVLDWLGARTVPRNQLRPGETAGTTYRDRIQDRQGIQQYPTPREAEARDAEGDSAIGKALVNELMGSHADRVRGSASMLDFLSLLLSLVFLRETVPAGWRDVEGAAKKGTGLEHMGGLLACIGAVADKELRRYGVPPGMRESLMRLEPRSYRDLVGVVRIAAKLPKGAFRLILDQYEDHAGLRSEEFFTPRGVVRLATELVLGTGQEAASIYDPYVRGGEMLVAAAMRHGSDGPGPTLHGESPRRDTLRFAGMNIALHGSPAVLRSTRAMPWTSDGARSGFADAVLTNPPFNMSDTAGAGRRDGTWEFGAPPQGNDNLAWVQHVMNALKPGGRAGMVMPVKAGNSVNTAEREIRRNLIEQGAVECVVALPPRLFSTTPVPVSLWFLRRTETPRPEVLLVDARHLGTGKGRRNVVGNDGLGAVLEVVRPWLSGAAPGSVADGEPGPHATVVPREAFAESGYSLSPMDHVPESRSDGPPAREELIQTHGEAARLGDLVHAVDADAAGLAWDRLMGARGVTDPLPPGWTEARLAELCEIQPGPSYTRLGKGDRSPAGEVPVVFPRQLEAGRILLLEEEKVSHEKAQELVNFRLAGGDVLCVRTGELRPPVLVEAEQEGWLLSTNLVRLRVRENAGVEPEYLVDHLSLPHSMQWMRDRAEATAAPSLNRDTLGHLPVRFPSVPEQREVVRVSALLRRQAALHREYADSLVRARAELLRHLMLGSSAG